MKGSFFFFSLLMLKNIHAQNSDECKYFQVLSFINTNTEFNKQVKSSLNLYKIKKRTKFIEFNVSPWIMFIEIRQFKDKIHPDSFELDKEIVSNDRLYYKRYNFEPYKSSYLEKTLEKRNASLYLSFSKVIGNTLLVEILNYDNNPKIIKRIGRGVKILFLFDQFGIITRTLFHPVLYN